MTNNYVMEDTYFYIYEFENILGMKTLYLMQVGFNIFYVILTSMDFAGEIQFFETIVLATQKKLKM